MKKLMIIAAVAFAAVVSQAATCQWTMMKVTPQAKASSYVGYLVDASKYTDASAAVDAIMKDGTSAAGVVYSAAGATYAVSGTDYVKVSVNDTAWTPLTGFEAGKSVSVYSILFDGTVGTGATATHYLTASDSAFATKVSDAGKLAYTNANLSGRSWNAIPEPTSGLLLLIGVAGLALRRKQK